MAGGKTDIREPGLRSSQLSWLVLLVEQQIAERRERAAAAIAKVLEGPGKAPCGDYRVQSASGKTYRVAMRGPGLTHYQAASCLVGLIVTPRLTMTLGVFQDNHQPCLSRAANNTCPNVRVSISVLCMRRWQYLYSSPLLRVPIRSCTHSRACALNCSF